MSVYASDPDALPDHDFEPGTLEHLVPGVHGRLLDRRRTPISVVEVQAEVGFVLIRIEAFEDEGATWRVPLEQIGHYQFEPGGPRASEAELAELERAIERFARDEEITADEHDRAVTEARIDERREEAHGWLRQHSRFLADRRPLSDPSSRRGDPLLADDLERYLRERGSWTLEDELTRTYVSNPGSGEVVKGHCIVLAELGLADYRGPIVRDPATFTGEWTRERRGRHIVTRLGFLRALFAALGLRRVTLWRGMSVDERRRAQPRRTFVSATFDEAVARSHFDDRQHGSTRFLVTRQVPVERLFMTYLETAAMNTVFLEAEAVVLDHHDDHWP